MGTADSQSAVRGAPSHDVIKDRENPLQIQSAGPRATKTDKLTGRGVPTSIGALSV